MLITTAHEADEHLATILDGSTIGFDLEGVDIPGAKLSRQQKKLRLQQWIQEARDGRFVIDWSAVTIRLVQIATEDGRVLVLDMLSIRALPVHLVRICESTEIIKVSAGIFSDGQRLYDSFRINLNSAVALGLVACLAYPDDILPQQPFADEPGLSTIVRFSLCYQLNKVMQDSRWDGPLSEEQHDYAAVDAHASLSAYLVLRSSLDTCGYVVDRHWYTFDVVNRSRRVCGQNNKSWTAKCSWWSDSADDGYRFIERR
ncbi:unnamed protein product [Mycena citricolor]|uniref:3'-5' exonuclease n=1 Tax=Mycena citricolor TaxID=2018698 RepID=A0AAD2JXY6_9AGAR|nr:unnamed protein product [Mycena citricolor]